MMGSGALEYERKCCVSRIHTHESNQTGALHYGTEYGHSFKLLIRSVNKLFSNKKLFTQIKVTNMPRSRPVTLGPARSGLIPGGSDHLNRYKILRRRQKRLDLSNRRVQAEEESSSSDHSLETDPDIEIQKVVNHVRTFASELYLPLREKHAVNLVYSPLGFCISATMLTMACQGLGKQELIQAMFAESRGTEDAKKENCDDDSSEMIIGISALLNCIKEDPASVTLKHAYKMFVDVNHKPKNSYLTRLKVLYHAAEIEEVDLSIENREKEFEKINHWAHSVGSKQLGDILTKRTVGNKIIFVVPMYFMGNWVHPFSPAFTHEAQFFINEKEAVEVPMMKSRLLKNLLYVSINKLSCRALVLPYKGERLALVIFLPNRKGGLPIIESGLESLSPTQYFQDMHKFRRKLASDSRFQVYLPRLRIDCTIDLESPLKEMGVETIFQNGKADFSGLVHISPKELSITQILQKVVIDINETGNAKFPSHFENMPDELESNKALGCGDDPGPEIIEFRVDHSFYFQIVDIKSDLIVFGGSCKNPLQGKELGFKEFLEKYDIAVPPKKLSSNEESIEIPPHVLNNTSKKLEV